MQHLSSGERGKEHEDRKKECEMDSALRLSLDSNEHVCDYSSLYQSRKQSSVGEVVEEKNTTRLAEDDQTSCDSVNTLDELCASNQQLERLAQRYNDFKPFEDISMREPEMKLRILKRTSLIPCDRVQKCSVRGPRLSAPATRLSTTMKSLDPLERTVSEKQVGSPKESPSVSRLPRYMQPTESFLYRIRPELAPSPPRRIPAKWIKEVDPHSLPNYMKLTEAAKGHYKDSIKPVLNATNSAPYVSRTASYTSSVLRTFDPASYDRIHAVKQEDVILLKEIRRVLTEILEVDQQRRESFLQSACVSIKKYTGPLPPVEQVKSKSKGSILATTHVVTGTTCTAPPVSRTVSFTSRTAPLTTHSIQTSRKPITNTKKSWPMTSTTLQTTTSKKQIVTSTQNKVRSLPRYMQPTEASRRREEENRKDRRAKGLRTRKDVLG